MNDPKCTVCYLLARVSVVAGIAVVVLGVIAGAIEIALRWGGHQPVPLAMRGLSATIPDQWTQWAMRPSVVDGPEYIRTNGQGMHEDREFSTKKTEGVTRVAVVGSSVVWGPGHNFENTIPRAAENKLKELGCSVEVMNFGNMGFSLINIFALMQIRVHQYNPDAVVLVTDLQVTTPRWPIPVPTSQMPPNDPVAHLTGIEAFFMRASEHSALLSLLYNTANARAFLERRFGLPVDMPPIQKIKTASSEEKTTQSKNHVESNSESSAASANSLAKVAESNNADERASENLVGVPTKTLDTETRDTDNEILRLENTRRKELGAVISTIATLYDGLNIPLYVTTPYGPYFQFSQEELKTFSLNMLYEEEKIYGGMDKALPRQVELATEILTDAATSHGAKVISFLQASRDSLGLTNKDFSSDAIHFSAQGNRAVGHAIADRLLADGICGSD